MLTACSASNVCSLDNSLAFFRFESYTVCFWEFHTRLPVLHWLPRRWHRSILKAIGFDFFADEQNLNLLDHRELRTMIDVNDQRERIKSCRLETIRLFGLVSNLVFILELRE